jgi:hypothetical protein
MRGNAAVAIAIAVAVCILHEVDDRLFLATGVLWP